MNYIASIEAKEKEIVDHWNPILAMFLSDDEPKTSQKVIFVLFLF